MAFEDLTFPHSLDAERTVLGALLLHGERLEDCYGVITADDFYRAAHQQVFSAMLRVDHRKQTVDMLTVKAELQRRGDLDEAGGPAYLAALTDFAVGLSSLDSAMSQLRDLSTRRGLTKLALRMVHDAVHAETASQALVQTQEALEQLASRDPGESEMMDEAQLSARVLELAEQWQRGEQLIGVPTGLVRLDRMTCGMAPGELVVAAARPGQGKSALALGILDHVSLVCDAPPILFSLEMSNDQNLFRLATRISNVNGHALKSGTLSDIDSARVGRMSHELLRRKMVFDESSSLTVASMLRKARKIQQQRGLSLVVVDYLQLLTPSGERSDNNRQEAVATMTRGCKKLARELKVPVLLLAQLNRQVEQRGNKRPQLSDLRESGAIEQDADQVWFLWPSENDDNTSRIVIAKQRNGPAEEVIDVAYHKDRFRFANLEHDAV